MNKYFYNNSQLSSNLKIMQHINFKKANSDVIVKIMIYYDIINQPEEQ